MALYHGVDDDTSLEESKEFIGHHGDDIVNQKEKNIKSRYFYSLPWALTVGLAIIIIWQNVYYQWIGLKYRSQPTLYQTDFGKLPYIFFLLSQLANGTGLEPMKPYISYQEVRFTSPIYLHSNGTFYRKESPRLEPKYVDAPADVLDANWDALLGGLSSIVGRDPREYQMNTKHL